MMKAYDKVQSSQQHSDHAKEDMDQSIDGSTDVKHSQRTVVTKHSKKPSYAALTSLTSLGAQHTAVKERKLSQSGQQASAQKGMSQTKSLKSSVLQKTPQREMRVTNKYVKPKADKPDSEPESKSAAQQMRQAKKPNHH